MVAQSLTTFLSYNPTGLNDDKCEWLNSLCETCNVTYISVQEHFRKSKTIDKYFKTQFPSFHSYVIPGFREEGQDRGRPKAGIAQLSRSSVGVRKDRVMSRSNRIQAQILNFTANKVLWINAYFPTDPGTIAYNGDELQVVLSEIERLMDSSEYDDVVIAADMNWDMSRQSGFCLTVRQFLDRVNLSSLWEHHPTDYTHMHTDDKSVSTIDHFLVNERLLGLVKDCGPMHLGDNMSRHSPIIVKFDFGSLPAASKSAVVRPRRPAWYKATEQQQQQYKCDLAKRLEQVQVPACLRCTDINCSDMEHSKARDGLVLDLLGAVIEASHSTIPMVGGRQGTKRKDCGSVPGWREEVAPYKEAARFWHSVWRSAGRPDTGELYKTMKMTRNKYHHAVRKVRNEVNRLKAQKLFEASMWGGADLVKELKKIRGGKCRPDLPETVAGANGEEEICQSFKQVYDNLYNSAPSVKETESLKITIQSRITQDDFTEVRRVTGEAVKHAASLMKKGKIDVSGSYGSDAIRLAPDELYDRLATVFRSWLVHGTISQPLLACAFMPLLKSSLKNPAETKSYRAIAGSATILMLFDKLLLTLWGDRLVSGSLQMGYKRGSSTAQCSYMVMETISYYLREGTNPILVALDMTQAFDKCRFDILFKKVAAKLPAVVVRAMIYMYERQHAWVRWGNTTSSTFGITNSTRQGAVSSPALFSLYVQELLDRLQNLGVGCHIGHTYVGTVAWADDFLLTSPTRSAMQLMLDTASTFVKEVGLEFSTDPDPAKSKSKAIFVTGSRKNLDKPAPLLLSGRPLPYVRQATHLGHEFSETGSMETDTRMRRGAFIGRCLEVQEAFSFAAPTEVLGAVKLYCGDLYGGMLSPIDSETVKQLTNCWNTCVKDVWGLPRNTHTVFTRWLSAGHTSLQDDLMARWPKFFRSLLTGPSPEAAVVARMAAADVRSTTAANNRLVEECCGRPALMATTAEVRAALAAAREMTEEEKAVAIQLTWELQDRDQARHEGQDYSTIQTRIVELCS